MRRAALALSIGVVAIAPSASADQKDVDACIRSFEQAQRDHKKGYLLAATEQYRSCATTRCPSAVRADCNAGLDTVARVTPNVTLIIRDQAGNDLDVAVELDGRAKLERGRAVDVDPGMHAISYEINGIKRQREFVAHEGEKGRTIVFTDSADAVAAKPSDSGGERETLHVVGPIAAGAVGLGLIVWSLASYFAYDGRRTKLQDRFDAACLPPGDVDPSCTPQQAANQRQARFDYDSNERDAEKSVPLWIGANIFGVLLLAGSATWFALAPRKKTTGSSLPVLAPAIGFGSASWMLSGSF